MAVQQFKLKKRDTRPVLEVALKDPDGSAHDLSGADSVTLHIRLDDGTTISRAMDIDADPTTGIVTYTWQATDWTNDPGLYPGTHRMEYEVLGPSDARLTFPNGEDGSDPEYDELIITPDIGQA